MEQEGQQAGGPSAETTSDSSVSLWILRGSRTYQIHGTGNQGTHCLVCGSAASSRVLPGPYRRLVFPFLLLTAALTLAKGLLGKALIKQQVPERKYGMGIYSYWDSGIFSTPMSLISHSLTLFLCHCSSISTPSNPPSPPFLQAAAAITTPSL